MTLFQSLARSAAIIAMTTGINAFAGDWNPYSEAAFKQAQADGKTVVLDFHADWCSTCKKQKPVLEGLLQEGKLEPVVGFTVDFDNAAGLKKSLKVAKQSTLIVYKGKNEVARNMGLTNKDEIKALIMKGI